MKKYEKDSEYRLKRMLASKKSLTVLEKSFTNTKHLEPNFLKKQTKREETPMKTLNQLLAMEKIKNLMEQIVVVRESMAQLTQR